MAPSEDSPLVGLAGERPILRAIIGAPSEDERKRGGELHSYPVSRWGPPGHGFLRTSYPR